MAPNHITVSIITTSNTVLGIVATADTCIGCQDAGSCLCPTSTIGSSGSVVFGQDGSQMPVEMTAHFGVMQSFFGLQQQVVQLNVPPLQILALVV